MNSHSVQAGRTGHRAPLMVNKNRLWGSLRELALIGAYDDEATGLQGVNRLALTDEDAAARNLVTSWMKAAGLAVRVDRMGNIFGRRAGRRDDLAPVMTGSHIDSVATAGSFDGCLGVLGAIEVIRSLEENAVTTERPIEVAIFTEEEGVRFGTDMLGSAVAAGRLPLDYAYNLTDSSGRRLEDELERIGFKGEADVLTSPPHAYVECHIEQGPILTKEGFDVGVVTGVQAISWLKLVFTGQAAHAGATPTPLRVDAGLAAAQTIVHARELVDSGRYGELRATAGGLTVTPGLPNVIPGSAEIVFDIRHPETEQVSRAEAALAEYVKTLSATYPGLLVETSHMARTRDVPFDPRIQESIAHSAEALGYRYRRLISGAGHDAQEIAALCPTAMVFVRGEYDGISHNPREYSSPEACEQGVNVLARTLTTLANTTD